MAKNVLVLSNYDEHGRGHGWSHYLRYKSIGLNADYICLLRTHSETQKYIIDALASKSIKFLWYKFVRFLGKLLMAPYPNMRAWYKGHDYATANDILKKLEFKPDYIVVCTYHFFLSPKSFYKLWKKTGATFIFVMTDEKILSGGCAYPLNCDNYKNGCRNCPRYAYAKFIPRYIVKQKEKYFSKMPFHILGSRFDLQRADAIPYLKGKVTHVSVSVPVIPFAMTKSEARETMGLNKDHFILLCGAVGVNNPVKGFREMYESIKLFSKSITNKKVTLLIAGKSVPHVDWPNNIDVVETGFLDLKGLFTAYYACDVFLSPSILDSGPYMVNYSIACGRPVISFEMGVAIDLVVNKKTGWRAELKNIEQYAEGMRYFYGYSVQQFEETEQICKEHIKSFSLNPWYNFMIESNEE